MCALEKLRMPRELKNPYSKEDLTVERLKRNSTRRKDSLKVFGVEKGKFCLLININLTLYLSALA
jgi:hypothetical protein